MDKQIFQLPAMLTKYKSKANKVVEFIFETQENMLPEHISKLVSLIDSLGWLSFAVRQIEVADIANLPKIDTLSYAKGKSPSQRPRV